MSTVPGEWASLGKRKAPPIEQTSRKVNKTDESDHDLSSSVSTCEGSEEQSTQSSISTPQTPLTRSSTPLNSARPKNYVCPEAGCPKAFSRPVRLEEHLRSHRNERIFQCAYESCDKAFLRQSHLDHHVKSAHSDIRDYVCDMPGCTKSFATGSRLRRHGKVHEGTNKHACTGFTPCNLTFRKQVTLQRHINAEHLNSKPFICDEFDSASNGQCGISFDKASQLNSHKAKHLGTSQFLCHFCPSIPTEGGSGHDSSSTCFPTKAELKAHITKHHQPACGICSLTCSNSHQLQKHIEANHSGKSLEERQVFICSIQSCGKGFTKQSNLNAHKRQVHEQRKFICGEIDLSQVKGLEEWESRNSCRREYGTKASLINHVKKHHLGQAVATRAKRFAQNTEAFPTSDLTGLDASQGQAQEQFEELTCFHPFCQRYFPDQTTLEAHARHDHGMDDGDIAEALTEEAALQGGPFWIEDHEDQDSRFEITDAGDLHGERGVNDFETQENDNFHAQWDAGFLQAQGYDRFDLSIQTAFPPLHVGETQYGSRFIDPALL